MTQPSLLDVAARIERPWKRARNVSRAQVTTLRDDGTIETRQREFLQALAAHKNRFNVAPTLKELTEWAWKTERIPSNDPNIFRPRATELCAGKRLKQKDGTYRIVGGGVIEFLPIRHCTITGKKAHPVRLKEV